MRPLRLARRLRRQHCRCIELRYFGRAHTGGDAFVIFSALRIAHVAYADTIDKAAKGLADMTAPAGRVRPSGPAVAQQYNGA